MSSSRNTSARKLRKQLFIAPRAQGSLMYRAMLHVVLSATATGLGGIALISLTSMTPILAVIVSVTVVSLVAVPITLFETAQTSNEVLGPFVRVQGAVRRLSYGDRVSKLTIRDNDMWQEWMHEFNAMIEQLQREDEQPDTQIDCANVSSSSRDSEEITAS